VAPKLFVRMLSWRDGTTEAAIVVRFSRAIVVVLSFSSVVAICRRDCFVVAIGIVPVLVVVGRLC